MQHPAAQAPVEGFRRPPDAIARIVEAPAAPDASLSPQRRFLWLSTREPLPGLDVVARPHLKLAGLRIDPKAHAPQRGTKAVSLVLRELATGRRPGRPISERQPTGRSVLRMQQGSLFLAGEGASPQGNRPFVDRWQVAGDGSKERLFRCADGRHETFVGFLDEAGDKRLIRSETPTEPPSLVVVDRATRARSTLLTFPDPAAKATKGVQKRLVKYTRADGVPLSGTLYLPPGYKDGDKLPCLIWAYPLEYSQASDVGQVRATPYRYLRLSGSSHLLALLAGYAVLDDAAMPIVGPQRTANDTFVQQLQQNAQAAVDALAKEGCIDIKRLAVAGHSYGAFMTATLVSGTSTVSLWQTTAGEGGAPEQSDRQHSRYAPGNATVPSFCNGLGPLPGLLMRNSRA